MDATTAAPFPDLVAADDLERRLEEIRAVAAGEREGVFGPRSISWRLDREAATFLGAGRALLLQLAHPWVAAGVGAHSRALADPIGRFHRTFDVVYTMTFGTLDQAFGVARRLHRRHEAVTGTLPEAAGPFPAGSPYWANEVEALRWVHATLADTSTMVHDLTFGPLNATDRERRWRESRVFAGLFGIPGERLPGDWDGFQAYCAAMLDSDRLTVTPTARAMATQLLDGAGTWLRSPGWYRAFTASLLPQRLRDGFGLAFGPAERCQAERALNWARRLYPKLPDRLRHVGPYQEAQARLRGESAPDLGAQALNRFWIGRRRMRG